MAELVYRGVRYTKADLPKVDRPIGREGLVYRGVRHDGESALRAARPVEVRPHAHDRRIYRGISFELPLGQRPAMA